MDAKGIVAGVVYSRFCARGGGLFQDCDMNIAARKGSLWATPEFLHRVFHYPFIQLGCKRVTALIGANNLASIKMVEHIGFKREAEIQRGLPDQNLLIYGLFPENCKWI